MSENPPAEPTGIKIGDLKKLITDTVAEVVKGINPTEDTGKKDDDKVDTNSSIAAKVQAEIEKIRKREADESEKETMKKQIADLAASKEQAPVERSRMHRLMGWGENAAR